VSAYSGERKLVAALVVLSALIAPHRATAQTSSSHLRVIAPAAPGGGWDVTARAMQATLMSQGLRLSVSVENIPGAAGTIGLARFIGAERGRSDVLLMSGLAMLLATINNYRSPLSLDSRRSTSSSRR
jgi:putative tricarboxylic transport membrane protein